MALTLASATLTAIAPSAMAVVCDENEPLTITRNTKLRGDLVCPGGIVVGADGITLDLGGFTVSGDRLGNVGVAIESRRNVTVRNGTVEGFDRGIHLHDADANKLRGLTVRDNNVSSGSGGIVISGGSDGNLVESNVLEGNTTGVFVLDSPRNKIRSNSVKFNLSRGIVVAGTSLATVVSKNKVINNGLDGTANNTACNEFRWGILVEVGTSATSITGNDASQNCGDGIAVDSASATIGSNTANYNSLYGIDGVEGVTDTGRNKATGNGSTIQCRYVICT